MATNAGARRILLVYTDKVQAATLVTLLASDEREVVACPATARVGVLVEDVDPDLIVLDPPQDRRQIVAACSGLRAETDHPMIVLSQERHEVTIAQALMAGADEYVALPIGSRELVARIDAMLRRAAKREQANRKTDLGGLVLVDEDLSVLSNGRRILLSPTEYRLLACLASAPGRVVTHDALMRRVWGPEYVASRHYLHLYIRYLREKLEDDPKRPEIIISEWGVGYRLQPPGVGGRSPAQAL